MIKSASHSRLVDFEQCRYRAKLKFIDKLPQFKSEHADRGTHHHSLAEDYVRGKGLFDFVPPELCHFTDEFKVLRTLYKAKKVSLEGEWGFDKDWMPCDYKTAWLRVKADAVAHITPHYAVVIDYKTGRQFGNEIKHGEQLQLYSIAVLIRNPDLKEITSEVWYLDHDAITSCTMKRAQVMRYVQAYDTRIKRMLSAKEFPPNPNIFSCKWCDYGPAKGGQCQYGTTKNPSQTIKLYREKFG